MLCGLYEVQDGLYFATYEHIFRFLLHPTQYLEFLEGLFVSGSPGYFEGVEFDGFWERSAFTNSNNITDLDVPGRNTKYSWLYCTEPDFMQSVFELRKIGCAHALLHSLLIVQVSAHRPKIFANKCLISIHWIVITGNIGLWSHLKTMPMPLIL